MADFYEYLKEKFLFHKSGKFVKLLNHCDGYCVLNVTAYSPGLIYQNT
jgi:hypothetical protein